VIAVPEFKIFRPVVVGVSVFVVHCFVRIKRATDCLLHDVAMFEHFPCWLPVRRRNADQNVFPSKPFRELCKSVLLSVNLAYQFILALTATRLGFSVDRPTRTAAAGNFLPAVDAGECRFVAIGLSPGVSASSRTIWLIFAELLAVGPDGGWLHRKCFAARQAIEVGSFYTSILPSVSRLMGDLASPRAKPLRGIFRFNPERLAAAFTNLSNRHGLSPVGFATVGVSSHAGCVK
jgi:hypothetical protein